MIKPSTYKVELIEPLAGCRHEVLKVLKVHPKLIANSESGSIASLSFTPDNPSFQSTGMQFQCCADFWTWFARIGILLLSNPENYTKFWDQNCKLQFYNCARIHMEN